MFEAQIHCSRFHPLVRGRWLVPVLIGLLSPTLALAQPGLAGDSVEGMPGELVEMAFAWTTAGDAAATQFDLVWDDSVLMEGNLVAGDALVGHDLDWEEIDPGRLRITVVTATPTPLADGILVSVPFQIAAEAPQGPWPVVVESVVVASTSGSAVSPVDVVDGEVIVLAGGPPPVEIPTMGTWGLLLLAALLAAGGWRRIGRRVLPPVVVLGIGLQMALTTPAGGQPIPGDANGDGEVDAADIPVIVDEILERAPAPGNPDCNGDSAVDVIDTVCVANTPPSGANEPVLDPIDDLQVREREIVALVATASDPDLPDDTLTWSLPERPVGASVDPTNGSILWVPTAHQLGTSSFRVRVTDEAGAFDEETFDVEVRALGGPPVLDPIADQQVVESTPLTVDAEADDPDLPGDTLVFDLLLSPAGMSIDPGSGLISWTPANEQIGTHDVTVRVTDQEGLLDFTPFVVEVLEINVAPTAGDDVFEARLGEPLSVEAPGVLDNDSDPNGDALSALLDTAASEGDLTLTADGSFEYLLEPPDRTTPVELELQCEASVAEGSRFQTLGGTIPVGDVDNDGDLELVGARHIEDNTFLAEVWFLNAADCSEQSFINIEDHGAVSSTSHLGLLDIDGDGDLEIIGTRDRFPFAQGGNFDREHLIAVHHDGTLAWPGDGGSETSPILDTEVNNEAYLNAGPTFADLDADGTVEIVMTFYDREPGNVFHSGLAVYNAEDGTLAWDYLSATRQGRNADLRVPAVVDLDLDGTMEILIHNNVVSHEGTLELELPWEPRADKVGHLVVAVANLDDDAFPEIIARDEDNHYVFEHDGTVKWKQPRRNEAEGQITVADFDGDDELEFVYLACGEVRFGQCDPYFLEMFDTDGSTLWSHQGQAQYEVDTGHRAHQNVTAFDANRDGALDVVWWNFVVERLFIFDGRDGSELVSLAPTKSFNGDQGFVSIADVDDDGHAELIVSATNGLAGATQVWEGSAANPLPSAPPYRNQWLFNEAMVQPDLAIPTNPVPHWLQPGLNGWLSLKPEPDPLIGTQQTFTYHANDGALDSNVATVTLDILPAGGPPRFLTEPDALTTRGFQYVYAPIVVDPDLGDVVTFHLTAGPSGMTIDPATGAVSWLPDTNGTFPVTILATDTIGFAVDQSWDLEVGDPVTTPDVVGLPQATAEAQIVAADLLVGRVSEATHPTIPAGSVSAQTPIGGSVAEFGAEVDLVISLGPAPEDVDNDGDGFTENLGDCNDADAAVFPGAPDPDGDGIDQNCDGFDGSEPVAEVVVEPATLDLLAGESRQLRAWAIFADGTAQIATAIADWQSTNAPTATVSATGRVTAVAGMGPAQITATVDAIVGTADVTVTGADASDDDAPTVEITSPEDGESAFGPIEVTGSADDPNLVRYELEVSPAGKDAFRTIAEGTTPVVAGVLGQIDPTLMLNGFYDLRLTVLDAGGNETLDQVTVQIDGEQKVGNFTLSFVDLQLPAAGLPVTVVRSYDSRDKGAGDFGVGWRLNVQTARIETSGVLGVGWEVVQSGLAFRLIPTRFHRVSLVLGNRVEEFDLSVTPTVSPLVPFPPFANTASFVPAAGTRGTLTGLDNNHLSVFGAQPGEVELVDDITNLAYDPDRFLYTGPEGTEIVISVSGGVESVTDPNGNVLTFTDDGIFHSSGQQALFERDASGRVVRIIDPEGNEQQYVYDGNGDLRRHVDREGNTVRFKYNRMHELLEVTGGNGNPVTRNEYDDDGRLIKSIDAQGNETTYDHDLDAQQEVITDRMGGVTVVDYDEQGNVLSRTDPAGNLWQYTYDSEGNHLSETDPEGHTTTVEWNTLGKPTRITDPLGNETQMVYDDQGRLLERTDATGRVTRHAYDARGNLIAVTDPAGATTRTSYDDAGNPLIVLDPNGNPTSWAYDSLGNYLERTDALGNTHSFERDANGNPLRFSFDVTNPAGTTTREWLHGFDANGQPTRVTVPGNAATTAAYDADGNLESGRLLGGGTWSSSRNVRGEITEMTSVDGSAMTAGYDAEGRNTVTDLPDLGTVRRQFDALGQVVSVDLPDTDPMTTDRDSRGLVTGRTDSAGNTTTLDYDAAGRNVFTEWPDGSSVARLYDPAGRIVSETDQDGNSYTYDYDAAGRLFRATDPNGVVRERQYDAAGNVIESDADNGEPWRYGYDAANRMISTSNALGDTWSYAYASDGTPMTLVTPDGDTYSLVYDALGNLEQYVLPEGESSQATFDADGRPVEIEREDDSKVAFAYDDLARTVTMTLDGASETFEFDARARLIRHTSTAGVVDIDRDGPGRLTSWQGPDGISIVYGRDGAGRVTGLQTPRGDSAFTYDAMSRVASMTHGGQTTTLTRDLLGLPETIAFPTGTTAMLDHDSTGRAQEIRYQHGAATITAYTYGYDSEGRIETIDRADGSRIDYQYDAAGRLVSDELTAGGSVLTEYDYDAEGNLVELRRGGIPTTFAYDGNNRLLASGDVTYAWDANGNLVGRTTPDATEVLAYDSLDQLVSYQRTGTDPVTVEYRYDHDGLLHARSENGAAVYYAWDRSVPFLPRLLEEVDEAGVLIRRYFYDGLFATHFVDAAGEVTVLVRDHLGSVRMHVDATGTVVRETDFDAYGNPSGGDPASLGFAGGISDPQSGLVYFQSRWYSPDMRRFVHMDGAVPELAAPWSINRYLYASADPVNRADPLGQSSETVAKLVTSFAITSLVFMTTHAAYLAGTNPLRLVASGFNVRYALRPGRTPHAKIGLLGRGSISYSGGIVGFTILGYEYLVFDDGHIGGYLFFGPSLTAAPKIKGGSPWGFSLGGGYGYLGLSRVYDTPAPHYYTGYFASISISVAASLLRKGEDLPVPVGIAGSFFWSPVRSYWHNPGFDAPSGQCLADGCNPRHSHGWSGGLALTSTKKYSSSLSLTYYVPIFVIPPRPPIPHYDNVTTRVLA